MLNGLIDLADDWVEVIPVVLVVLIVAAVGPFVIEYLFPDPPPDDS